MLLRLPVPRGLWVNYVARASRQRAPSRGDAADYAEVAARMAASGRRRLQPDRRLWRPQRLCTELRARRWRCPAQRHIGESLRAWWRAACSRVASTRGHAAWRDDAKARRTPFSSGVVPTTILSYPVQVLNPSGTGTPGRTIPTNRRTKPAPRCQTARPADRRKFLKQRPKLLFLV